MPFDSLSLLLPVSLAGLERCRVVNAISENQVAAADRAVMGAAKAKQR